MFLSLWNNIRGYVAIEVSGFSVERFINLAVHKGVYIWDIQYSKSSVIMKVSIKGFKLLKSCARKTKCKIKILNKKGLPFVAYKYRKRKIFAFGIIFFVFILYSMSSFIWQIDIQGNNRVSSEELLSCFKNNGLDIGKFKYQINNKKLENDILTAYKDISWIKVSIKGTKVYIEVKETLEKQEIIDKTTPCNIVAKKDGLITSIVTSSGTPKVKQKDVVSEGEVLVSGEIVVKEDETGTIKRNVNADAEIRAKIYYYINFDVAFNYEEKIYTEEIKNRYDISFFDKKINFLKNRIFFDNYDKITSRTQLNLGENYPLPIIFFKETYKGFVYKEKTRNIEQAKELAEIIINARLIREFDISTDIIDKKIDYIQYPDSLKINAVITTIERIDKKIPIKTIEETQDVEAQ